MAQIRNLLVLAMRRASRLTSSGAKRVSLKPVPKATESKDLHKPFVAVVSDSSSATQEALKADEKDHSALVNPVAFNLGAGDNVRLIHDLKGGELVLLTCRASTGGPTNEKAAVAKVTFHQTGKEAIFSRLPGFGWSKAFGNYVYVPADIDTPPFQRVLLVPAGVEQIQIDFHVWNAKRLRFEDVELKVVSVSSIVDGGIELNDASSYRVLAKYLKAEGRLKEHIQTLQRIYATSGLAEDAKALDMAVGEAQELDPAWTPSVHLAPVTDGAIRQPHLKVAHLHKVSYPYESSGGSIRNLSTVRSQKSAGIEPFVITPLLYPKAGAKGNIERRHVDGIVHYHIGGHDSAHESLRKDRLLQLDTFLTAEIIHHEKPSLIHAASGFRGYELALKALPIARALNLPFIYEVRSFHEHLWGPNGTLDSELTQLRMAQENRCMVEADAVVTISQAMKSALVERGVPGSKITVVPNAVEDHFLIDPERIPDRRVELNIDGKIVVGYISNFSTREGHDVLLHAIKAMEAVPDIHCLLVGDGPSRAEMERLAQELEIIDRVTFTGEVDHAAVKEYYKSIDVFVVPRKADYAADYVTPLKPFEALALERPLVMSDRPVASEIVGAQERGRLFRTEDVDALCGAVMDVINHPEATSRMAERGRSWILSERSWDRNARVYADLYRRILKSFRRPSEYENRNINI